MLPPPPQTGAKSCPVEEVMRMLHISISIKVTAGAAALLLTILLRSCS